MRFYYTYIFQQWQHQQIQIRKTYKQLLARRQSGTAPTEPLQARAGRCVFIFFLPVIPFLNDPMRTSCCAMDQLPCECIARCCDVSLLCAGLYFGITISKCTYIRMGTYKFACCVCCVLVFLLSVMLTAFDRVFFTFGFNVRRSTFFERLLKIQLNIFLKIS